MLAVACGGLHGGDGGGLVRAQAPPSAASVEILAETFEVTEAPGAVPDGWYNLRDAVIATGGDGPGRVLRFESVLPGRLARASRAFAIDGASIEALDVSIRVRVQEILMGERLSEVPLLAIDLLGKDLAPLRRLTLGPWLGSSAAPRWLTVRQRLSVPLEARDAILTLGLFGATGRLEVDDLTIRGLPRGGVSTTNLVLNGSFEYGDTLPTHWEVEGRVARVVGGTDPASCSLLMEGAAARAAVGLQPTHGPPGTLRVSMRVRGAGLRPSGTGAIELLTLDRDGRLLTGNGSAPVRELRLGGTFGWRSIVLRMAVPAEAALVVLRISKRDAAGALGIDEVQVQPDDDQRRGLWTAYHESDDTHAWTVYEAAAAVEAGSALDFAFLRGPRDQGMSRLRVDSGHLYRGAGGERAYLFGVSLVPPVALAPWTEAEALLERLSHAGINLIRFIALDAPIGPGLGLLDDARDDTAELDPIGRKRLGTLIAGAADRSIATVLDLQSLRRFREGDQVPDHRRLDPGGGPEALLLPSIRERALAYARSLLTEPLVEGHPALADSPALAWVALAGELSLFDLETREELTPAAAAIMRAHVQANPGTPSSGPRLWEEMERRCWENEAKALREMGVGALLAGSSHWRREPQFAAAQAGPGLDLVDDRIYWSPPLFSAPDRRSLLWQADSVLKRLVGVKRSTGRPYALGDWSARTVDGIASDYEGADLMLMTAIARDEGWDAVIRRGITAHPVVWGAAAMGSGAGGVTDLNRLGESINASPALFELMPHAASLFLRRGGEDPAQVIHTREPGYMEAGSSWTLVVAGWPEGRVCRDATTGVELQVLTDYGVAALSSASDATLGETGRMLLSVVGRFQPRGLAWASAWRRQVADPGGPTLLQEPVLARLTLQREAMPTVHELDAAGKRLQELQPLPASEPGAWTYETKPGIIHYEIQWD